jgi:DNA-binding response OmpR family regulator
LRALRARPETTTMPVMMLTARGQDRDRAAAELAGADLFMAKPFSNAEFLQAAQRLLARGPAADRGAVGA